MIPSEDWRVSPLAIHGEEEEKGQEREEGEEGEVVWVSRL